ncbi:hypothetical protein G6F65_012728 [Rhizopus arrhizus]|nr:hypothetical protein G6F65_012728 [Rhizopus arrhizus]
MTSGVVPMTEIGAGVDGVVGRYDGQRVAVGLRGHQLARAGDARRARQILDDQGLRERLAQVFRHHAGDDVGGGPRRCRHDQADRMVGVARRLRGRRGQQGAECKRTARQESGGGVHVVSVSSQRGLSAPAWAAPASHVKGAL